MKLGDRVHLENGEIARIVCDYDRREFSADYPESEWGDAAQTGILVVTEKGARVRVERHDVCQISD